jgi:DnaJ family protein C protein 13
VLEPHSCRRFVLAAMPAAPPRATTLLRLVPEWRSRHARSAVQVCHLAGAAAAGVPPSVPLAQRSILGGLLPGERRSLFALPPFLSPKTCAHTNSHPSSPPPPTHPHPPSESLLHMLESYGPDAFAAALAGDAETPELVWTAGMRGQRLVPQMLRHLGDFPGRLRESCHALYDYTPCPPVGYPEIEVRGGGVPGCAWACEWGMGGGPAAV